MCGFVSAVSPSPFTRSCWSAVIAARFVHRKYANATGSPQPYSDSDSDATARMRTYVGLVTLHRMDGSAVNTDTPLLVEHAKGIRPVRTITAPPRST